MNHLQILFIFLAIVCIIGAPIAEAFSSLYIAKPTKSVDSQREMPEEKKYMGTPSKCFDCEEENIRNGVQPDWAQNTKCFDCETQVASRR
jgi:hypothetical protein